MKKTGWLVYRQCDAERNWAYIQWMKQEASRLDWRLHLIYRDEVAVGIRNGLPMLRLMKRQQPQTEQQVQAGEREGQKTDRTINSDTPDFVIMRTADPVLTTHLEQLQIPVFNSAEVSRICNHKALTYQYLQQFNIPMLDAEFCNTADLTAAFSSQSTFRSRTVPFVIKTATGRGGKNVALIERPSQLEAFINQYPGTDVVLQQLGPVSGKDIRVFVVGDEIVAAVLRSAASADFRANFSLGGRAERYHLNQSETNLVKRIVSQFEFGMAGIDFLPDGAGGLLFNEIEDVVGSRTLSQVAPDVNIVRRYLAFIATKLSDESNGTH